MNTMKEALPAEERKQENPSPDYTAQTAVEQQALEAIRRGLFAAGVEKEYEDLKDAKRALDAVEEWLRSPMPDELPYRGSDGYRKAAMEVDEIISRGLGTSGIEHDDWDFIAHKVMDSLKEAGLLKPDFESIVQSVEPNARTQRFLSVYYPWPHRRTLAEAQKVAAAIVAEFGGSVDTVRFSKSPKEGCVKVTACGTEINIYFEDEEGAQ